MTRLDAYTTREPEHPGDCRRCHLCGRPMRVVERPFVPSPNQIALAMRFPMPCFDPAATPTLTVRTYECEVHPVLP